MQLRAEIDSRITKRALRAKLGMGSDRHLAALLQLPVEEVEAWPEEDALPALPQIKCLLGIEEKKESRAQDPDDGRIIRVEVA